MAQDNIYTYVRKTETRYRSGNTKIAKYVDHSLFETVQRIYAYINSRHISGEQDSLGRDKPFFNIVTAARNIWFRATDLDRKNIMIRETDSKHVVGAFLATIKLQDWMRRQRFGVWLNDWGLTMATFGSAISKWVMKDDELIPSVVSWNQIIVDTIDFNNNAKIEIFEFTEAQLRAKKEYDQDVVESLCQALTIRMLIDNQYVDIKPEFVKVYEVHGQFPLSYLSGDEEKDGKTFVQQMNVISYVRTASTGKYQDFCLFKGREAMDPYHIAHLIPEDGRTLSIGSVEHLFNAQWMVNHSVKSIKDQLDLASKLIFQTSDPAFVGQNALTSIETGQILNHKVNEPVTSFPNGSHDTATMESFMAQWKAIGQEANGVTDAMIGIRPKQGTSWRMQNLQLQEAQALFDLMKQNKGLALEDLLRERIIPFLRTQLKTSKQIVATLDSHNIKKIDSMYIPKEGIRRFNKKVIDHVLKTGTRPVGIDLQSEMAQVQAEQNQTGNVRYFAPSEIPQKTWDDMLADLEWDIEVDITGEASDTNAILQTLNTALQIVVNPGYAQNPQAQMIVQKILLETGRISPLEMTAAPAPQPAPAASNAPSPSAPSPGKGAPVPSSAGPSALSAMTQ